MTHTSEYYLFSCSFEIHSLTCIKGFMCGGENPLNIQLVTSSYKWMLIFVRWNANGWVYIMKFMFTEDCALHKTTAKCLCHRWACHKWCRSFSETEEIARHKPSFTVSWLGWWGKLRSLWHRDFWSHLAQGVLPPFWKWFPLCPWSLSLWPTEEGRGQYRIKGELANIMTPHMRWSVLLFGTVNVLHLFLFSKLFIFINY